MRKNGWKLVFEKTGAEIEMHVDVVDFRGNKGRLEGGRPPHKEGSTGFIWVRPPGAEHVNEVYPGVCDLKWVKEDA